jgi:hypothetical protein
MLEQKTQINYNTLRAEALYQPLRLNNTGTIQDVSSHNWRSTTGSMTPVGIVDVTNALRLPVGGLSTSIEDAARFAYGLMLQYERQPRWQLWSSATQATIAGSFDKTGYSPVGFAMAMNDAAGGLELAKDGSARGEKAWIILWPNRKMGFVAMTNYTDDDNVVQDAADFLLNDLMTSSLVGTNVSLPGGEANPVPWNVPPPFPSYWDAQPPSFPHPNAFTLHPTNVTASSSAPGSDPSFATDGSYASSWTPSTGGSEWMSVTIPTATVGHIVINEGDMQVAPPGIQQPIEPPSQMFATAFPTTSYMVWLWVNGVPQNAAVAQGTTIGVETFITLPTPQTNVTGAMLLVKGNGSSPAAIKEFHLLP